MFQIILIGLGAGVAAALLFASIASGSFIAILLFYLAPLPIMIVALGWSQLAGLIAAASATSIVAALSGVFLVPVGVISLGAWWLGYLTMLARPVINGGGTGREWYPIGRLIVWAAAVGTLVVAAAVPNFGTDQQSVEAGLRMIYGRIVRDQAMLDLLVAAVPLAAAMFCTVTNLFNLWLAARIVKISATCTAMAGFVGAHASSCYARNSGGYARRLAFARSIRDFIRCRRGKSLDRLRNSRPCGCAFDNAHSEEPHPGSSRDICGHTRPCMAAAFHLDPGSG